jgi:hypothetical protein
MASTACADYGVSDMHTLCVSGEQDNSKESFEKSLRGVARQMIPSWREIHLPADDTEYNRLLNVCARRVIAKYPQAWCGVVISGGPRVNTYFVWEPSTQSNLSEGCSGPLMAWFEAMEVCR